MTYTMQKEHRDGYLFVSASGQQSFEGNLELAKYCLEEIKSAGIIRILIDITGLTGQPGLLADYEAAKLINTWTFETAAVKAAMVEKETDIAAGKFFETAVRNRGTNLMVFAKTEDALRWLLA